MKYELLILRRAQKQLADIPQPDRNRIVQALRSLSNEPRPAGAVKLTGRNGWRIRVGDYRVIYEVKDEALVVMVISIGHRREIYDR